MTAKPIAWFKTDVRGRLAEFVQHEVDAATWQEQGFILTPAYAEPTTIPDAAQSAGMREALEAIVIRCKEGDKKFDWLETILDIAERAIASQPSPAATVETDRKTFIIPPGYEAVRDGEGRATGEVRPSHSGSSADNTGLISDIEYAITCAREDRANSAVEWLASMKRKYSIVQPQTALETLEFAPRPWVFEEGNGSSLTEKEMLPCIADAHGVVLMQIHLDPYEKAMIEEKTAAMKAAVKAINSGISDGLLMKLLEERLADYERISRSGIGLTDLGKHAFLAFRVFRDACISALSYPLSRSAPQTACRFDKDGQTCPTCGRVGNGEG